MKLRWRSCIALASALAILSCAADEPTGPGTYSITGPVVLRGYLVHSSGAHAGTAVVGDADGVLVELVYAGSVVARTHTVDGTYRFTGIGPGGYLLRAPVVPGFGDESEPITVANHDLHVADTLRLTSQGDLTPVPNPTLDTTRVFFELAVTQHVEMKILDLAGNLVRTLRDNVVTAGLRSEVWDGRDASGDPVVPGYYWATWTAGADVRAHLLLRSGKG